MKKKVLGITLSLITLTVVFAEKGNGSWPLPQEEPWSNVILSPHDQIMDTSDSSMETFGELLLGGKENDTIIAIESGIITYSNYVYCPSWRTSFSDDNLEELMKEVSGLPDSDIKSINIWLCITSKTGDKVYYGGLVPDQPLPKTGSVVNQGQILGRLGYAYPNQPPNLCLSGSSWIGLNRILGLLESPFPVLQIQKPKSRSTIVKKEELLNDIDIFWNTIVCYYPDLYGLTTKNEIENSITELRNCIPPEGISVREFANRLRKVMRLFSDNHMSLWESYSNEDAVYLPIEIGAIDGNLYIISSVHPLIPKGVQVNAIDQDSAKKVIEKAYTQVGRSDGNIGTWEQESLSRNVGQFWLKNSGYKVGDKAVIELANGSKVELTISSKSLLHNVDWWSRNEHKIQSRGQKLNEYEDTQNIVIRKISPDTEVITLYSFDLTDTEKEEIDRYFSRSYKLPANLILDLRNNPGGEEESEWFFINYLIPKKIFPFEYKTVKNSKITVIDGVTNLVDGDKTTFNDYNVDINGTYKKYPEKKQMIGEIEKNYFKGNILILSNGMTGSAAFDAIRILQANTQAVVIGRPGPHGTNRMVADKFAQVYLPSSCINLRIPMVKIITEKNGDYGLRKIMSVDFPVPISLDSLTGDADPELDIALTIVKER